LPDFEVLFAVQEHHGGEVGHDVGHGEGRNGVEGRDYAKGWEDLELVVVFEDEWKVGTFGTNAEICVLLAAVRLPEGVRLTVKDDIALGVGKVGSLRFGLLRGFNVGQNLLVWLTSLLAERLRCRPRALV